jgi:pimeloyl-ACP methyl ester carboxylesterase
MTVNVGGLEVFYYDGGQGEPALFLHGWGVDHSLYLPMLEHLSKRMRVVAPDMPGFGQTKEPKTPWDAHDYARFTLAFAQAVGLENPVLLGHSNGGRVILKLLGGMEQDALRPPRAVLMDASGLKPKRGADYYAKVYAYKAGKWLLKPFPALYRRLTQNAGSADYRAASPVMRGTLSKLLAEDLTACLPNVRVPTLLLWGEQDTATPLWMGQLMEKRIPDAGLVVFPGGSHYGFLEHWAQCARVLDSFLGNKES